MKNFVASMTELPLERPDGWLVLQPGRRYHLPAVPRGALRVLDEAAAGLLMATYVGMPYVLLALTVAAFYSRSALLLLLLAAGTLLLPKG